MKIGAYQFEISDDVLCNLNTIKRAITLASQNDICIIVTQYHVRKLTPKEYWRLMGFSDEDYEKAAEVNSKTQLYKQSGNSIVRDVLMAIFSQLNIKGVPMWNEVHHGTK